MQYVPTHEILNILRYSNRVYLDSILVKSKFEPVNKTVAEKLLDKYLDKIIYYTFNSDSFEVDLFT